MAVTYGIGNISDSHRDAERYNRILLALKNATWEIRRVEKNGLLDIDGLLDRLLPDLAAALNAEQAFVAMLQEDEDGGKKWLELTAAYPMKNLRRYHLEWSELLRGLVNDGITRVIDPLGEEVQDPIPGLEIFDATSAVLVRMETLEQVRVVGICNKVDPDLGPYLVADGMALDNIVELVAIGVRIGERRRRELEGIQKTSSAISAELELDGLLPMIAGMAAEVFDAPGVSLMLWDESGENLVIKASWGLSDEYVQQQRISREKAHTAIQRSGELLPFTVVDLRLEPFGQVEQIERERLCSVLVVPLEVGGEPIGALNIYSRDTPRQFTQDEKELSRIFANQAVIAIQNARVYQRVIQRVRAMESLEKLGRTIVADLDLHHVLRLIVENATKVLGADISSVFLLDESTKQWFPFGLGNLHGTIQTLSPERMPKSKGLAARVVRDKKLLIVEDVASEELAAKSKIVIAERIRSFVCCPLLAGEDVLGLLYVDFCTRHRFNVDELLTVQMFANQAAIAIKNASQYEDVEKAYQDAEKARKRLDIVAAIGKAVSSTLDFERVLDTLLIELGKLINAPDRGILLYDEASDELIIHPSSHYNLDCDKRHITEVRVGEGITGWVAKTKEPCNVADVTGDPRYLTLISGSRSELAVPVLYGDELVGVINLESPNPSAFDEEDVKLLQAIADQVAIAIRNVRQYEAILRQSQHWQALHEASKAITAGFTARRKQVLDRIVEQAVERITGIKGPKAVWGAVMLYDEATNKLQFESVYPPEILPEPEASLSKSWLLDRDKAPGGRIGITGRTIFEGKPQRVKDVRTDPDYLEFNATARSELDVPLLDGHRVIGVLSVESDQVEAFDEDDEQALQGLAELTVIAIKNAERTEQLARSEMVALMGAWGTEVTHDVNREVGAIRRTIWRLQRNSELSPHVKTRLQEVDHYAENLALPELPRQPPVPGHGLRFRDACLLDTVISAEIDHLRDVYSTLSFRGDLNCQEIWVAMHKQWLRRLLRHLVRNAVNAISPEKEEHIVTVRTKAQDPMVTVQVEDTGKGVRPEIIPLLFKRPIPHEDGQQGCGLLVVRFVIEQHGGRARLVRTQPGQGTCFAFSIPIAERVQGSQASG